MKKKRLLIINKKQFGTLTDVYMWCYYLRDSFDITVLCFDVHDEKITMDGVRVKYVSWNGSKSMRGIRYLLYCIFYLLSFRGTVIVEYFEHCDKLKLLFPYRKIILDIRTLDVTPDADLRMKANKKIVETCKLYDKVTVISEGVKERIGNVGCDVSILPLGADCISEVKKDYSEMKLLYVGTLNGRDIHKTIDGISIFHKKNPNCSLKYDIVGSGKGDMLQSLKKQIKELKLEGIVSLHGTIPYNRLKPFFDSSNIGVSFVPITDYYHIQPPTKTFEYALSGLYSIATATNENRKIISADNGILIQDTAENFATALEWVKKNTHLLDENKIRMSLRDSSWERIVNLNLKSILLMTVC